VLFILPINFLLGMNSWSAPLVHNYKKKKSPVFTVLVWLVCTVLLYFISFFLFFFSFLFFYWHFSCSWGQFCLCLMIADSRWLEITVVMLIWKPFVVVTLHHLVGIASIPPTFEILLRIFIFAFWLTSFSLLFCVCFF
jgi:hypothetical protein